MNNNFSGKVTAVILVLLFVLNGIAFSGKDDDNNKHRNPGAVRQYASSLREGQIGVNETSVVDNPADNVFHVAINDALQGSDEVWLVYELDGVSDHHAVSRSINNQLSYGGYLVKKHNGWVMQRERIDVSWLRRGDNIIRFTLPGDARHSYKVRRLSIDVKSGTLAGAAAPQLVIAQPSAAASYNGNVYLKGFASGEGKEKVRIKIDGKEVRVLNGAFEYIIQGAATGTETARKAVVEAIYPNGRVLKQDVLFSNMQKADFVYEPEWNNRSLQQLFSSGQKGKLALEGAAVVADAGALKQATALSITTLRKVDLPALDAGMVNVTAGHGGYRFLPHPAKFARPVAVEMEYDKTKIPEGYSEKDIRTFYFDEKTNHWAPLHRDSVSVKEGKIYSRTTHFTDMMNAVIKAPESPEAAAYNSNSIKGIQAANPAAGITLIPAPGANSQGTANLSFPIKIPAGRAGMQPQLAITYNSNGGNGWLGMGWDLNVPFIGIDTRWGVPRYDSVNETETYVINNQQLSPVGHREVRPRVSGDVQFYPRIEGGFSKIIRHGNSPKNYWWEVTDKNDTKYYYGGTPATGVMDAAVLITDEGNIANWYLREVRDPHGNFMRYYYQLVTDNGVAGQGIPGRNRELVSITYTGFGSQEGAFNIQFVTDRQLGESKRKDITINGRLGFKQVTVTLLRKIIVNGLTPAPGNPPVIRTYNLFYKEGAFHKTLLDSITETDVNGNKNWAATKFNYYDDVNASGGYTPYTQRASINVGGDFVSAEFPHYGPNIYHDRISGLGGSKSAESAISGSVLVGFDGNPYSTSLSAGITGSYEKSEDIGLIDIVDINGDGLADKLFLLGDMIKYRLGKLDTDGNFFFSGTVRNAGRIEGQSFLGDRSPVNKFHYSKTKGWSVGGTINAGISYKVVEAGALLRAGGGRSVQTTYTYVQDVNGDGVLDIVNNNRVYFGAVGKPYDPSLPDDVNNLKEDQVVYHQGSSLTPNPINTEQDILEGMVVPNTSDQEEIERTNPLQDAVITWEAPFTGRIKIDAKVKLIPCQPAEIEDSLALDGVNVSIQVNNEIVWVDSIMAGNSDSLHYPVGIIYRDVKAGDRVFFRVGSRYEGSCDKVKWSPLTIAYTEAKQLVTGLWQTKYVDPNYNSQVDALGRPLYFFDHSKEFLATGDHFFQGPVEGKVRFNGTFSKPVTASDVIVSLICKNEANRVVWSRIFPANQVFNNEVFNNYTINAYGGLTWVDFTINPDYEYYWHVNMGSDEDPTRTKVKIFHYYESSPHVPDSQLWVDGKPAISFYATPAYDLYYPVDGWRSEPMYPYQIITGTPPPPDVPMTVYAKPTLRFTGGTSYWTGRVKFIIRDRTNKVWWDHTYSVVYDGSADRTKFFEIAYPDNEVIPQANLAFPLNSNNSFYAECYISSTSYIQAFQANIFYPGMEYTAANSTSTIGKGMGVYYHNKPVPIEASVSYSAKSSMHLGAMYRGWGHFGWNNPPGVQIIRTGFNLPEMIDPYRLFPSNKATEPMLTKADIERLKNIDPNEASARAYYEENKDKLYKSYEDPFVKFTPVATANSVGFVGTDRDIYIRMDTIASSRAGENDIRSLLLKPLGAVKLPYKRQTIKTSYFAGGASAGVGYVGGGFVGQYANTSSSTDLDLLDMNGDRYPDVIANDNESRIQYTNTDGQLENRFLRHLFGGSSYTESKSSGVTGSGKANISRSNLVARVVKSKNGGLTVVTVPENSFFGGGDFAGGYSTSGNEVSYQFLDINGDGLPDRVDKNGRVYLNLGYRFSANDPQSSSYDAWNYSGGILKSSGRSNSRNVAGDVGVGTSPSGQTTFYASSEFGYGWSDGYGQIDGALMDINGDELPDDVYLEPNGVVKVKFNTGAGFGTAITWSGINMINKSNSIKHSNHLAFTTGVTIGLIKIVLNASVEETSAKSSDYFQLKDINGDGFPDALYENTQDVSKIDVQFSTIGRTNLLKTVTQPLGSVITLDYARAGNSYRMPQNIWTLSRVKVEDGFNGDGADSLVTVYRYDSGYYSRRERQFYGFKTVTARSLDVLNGNKVYKSVIDTFINDNYYLQGLLEAEVLLDSNNRKYSSQHHSYQLLDWRGSVGLLTASYRQRPENTSLFIGSEILQDDKGWAFPALVESTQAFYEGQEQPGKTTRQSYLYGEFGNVIYHTDYGEPADSTDDVVTRIQYFQLPQLYGYKVGIPFSTDVKVGDSIYRQTRVTSLDYNTGLMKEITQTIGDGRSSVTNMEYNPNGTLKKITKPANATGQRLSIEYTYDNDVATYPVKIKNSYGDSSAAGYNANFGVIIWSEDINRNRISYFYDFTGRLTKVNGPYGTLYTISFTYFPEATTPYAVTNHYDKARHYDPLQTVTFVDGLGRAIQVKKDVAIYQGDGMPDKAQMVVSGKVLYDAFGRATDAFYPVTEDLGNSTVFNPAAFDNVRPTVTTYDVLNRPLSVMLPDSSITRTAYGFGNDRNNIQQFKTQYTDANGVVSEQFTNVRGLTTASRVITQQGSVWTSFMYDPLDQLVSSTNDLGHSTTYKYDMLGRRIERNHPDAGTTRFTYDAASNLTAMETANLLRNNDSVKYKYHYGRLTDVEYPGNPENNVHYTYGAPGAGYNRTGRVVLQSDATGAQEFYYGPLGEVVKNVRSIVIPGKEVETYVTEWKYDTWGRLDTMIYPDGEKVIYTYNEGGMLNKMTGIKNGATYNYIQQLGYDKFESRVFLAYGNGAKTTYQYENDRRRLKNVKATTSSGRYFMHNTYTYDKESNITNLVNVAPAPPLDKIGGPSSSLFRYDELNRLVFANTQYTAHGGADYKADYFYTNFSYNSVGGMVSKQQTHQRKTGPTSSWVVQTPTTYAQTYAYGANQPNAPVQIGSKKYSYDANGNVNSWQDTISGLQRTFAWDEENRLMGVMDNGGTTQVNFYDASGERVLKGSGASQGVFVNGVMVAGSDSLGSFDLYVNPYVVVRGGGAVTKHYYVESQRIASKLGSSFVTNLPKAGGSEISYEDKKAMLENSVRKILQLLSGATGAGGSN